MAESKFFRADEDTPRSEKTTPSPGEWFGIKRSKYRDGGGAIADEGSDGGQPHLEPHAEGWEQFFKGSTPREPLWNPLMPVEKKEEAIKFKDEGAIQDQILFVLENVSEALEAAGHIDLAAECENICELVVNKD